MSAELVTLDCADLESPTLAALEEICRQRVAASRVGTRLVLENVRPKLVDLIRFVGLKDVLEIHSLTLSQTLAPYFQGAAPTWAQQDRYTLG